MTVEQFHWTIAGGPERMQPCEDDRRAQLQQRRGRSTAFCVTRGQRLTAPKHSVEIILYCEDKSGTVISREQQRDTAFYGANHKFHRWIRPS